jgi:hypothetical protein
MLEHLAILDVAFFGLPVMGGSFSVRLMSIGVLFMRSGTVVFMKLLGAIGTFKIMALAGNGKHGNGHKKDGE